MPPKRSILWVKWDILWGLLFSKENKRCHMHGALVSTCHAAKPGVCIWEAFLHTHRRVLVPKCVCLSLMWLCSNELIQYHTEVNGRWVRPTSLLTGIPICMSMSLFWSWLLFSAACSLSPFSFHIFHYENTAYTLPLWGVPCGTRNTSMSVLYVALTPEEGNGKHWRLMVLSTLLGSLLDQPHKLYSLFLVSTLSPVCITLAPALQR